ncbi:hypothetical protein LCGC14_2878520, partial [marine sediment metagenome]
MWIKQKKLQKNYRKSQMRLLELIPVFQDVIPTKDLVSGVILISEKYGASKHFCACGCGKLTVLPINDFHKGKNMGWSFTKHKDGTVSFHPSVGNFSGQKPYHAHYY